MSSILPSVLVVDDDISTIRLHSAMLKGMARVFFATNGADALRLASLHHPTLMLLDGEMPLMNGFDVLEKLRADPNLCKQPVALVTAYNDAAQQQRALDLGARCVLLKPLDPDAVREMLQALAITP